MPKNAKEMESFEEINIPLEYIKKIDKIVRTGTSVYPSREEFIKGAVEIKLAELRKSDSK
jgi:hypothetical protein